MNSLILFSSFLVLFGFSPLQTFGAKPSLMRCVDQAEAVFAQLVNPKSYYSESPYVKNGVTYHVEFSQDRVIELGDGGQKVLWSESGCGPAAVTGFRGGFLVACYASHKLVQLSDQGVKTREWLSPVGVHPAWAPNDLVADSAGGLYFTSSGEFNAAPETPIEGRVYYLSPTDDISEVASRIHYSNGIALSGSGDLLLVSEHLENRILKYPVVRPGVVGKIAEVFADLNLLFPWTGATRSPYLGPDGFRVSRGVVFVAQYAGSRILKLNESGQRVGEIIIHSEFPNTTNVWVDGNSLYFSAVRDDAELGAASVYPAIVGRIDDPRLLDRVKLVCEIN